MNSKIYDLYDTCIFTNTYFGTDIQFLNTDEITKVEILKPDKVVRVTFGNGDVQKAVCSDDDTFTLEHGIEICIGKHYAGGTKQWNNAVRKGMKCYMDECCAKMKEEVEKARIDKRRKKNAEKRQKKEEARQQREYEEKVQIQMDAILRANSIMRAMEGDN